MASGRPTVQAPPASAASPWPTVPVVLVGLSGVGKSTVGSLVASLLDRPFVDLDVAVEEQAGRPIRQIIEDDGEGAFRTIEARMLADVLAGDEPVVVATGGGVVLDRDSRALLAERAAVVWLDSPVECILERLGPDELAGRPLLDDGPAEVLAALDAARRPLYAEVATVTVDASVADPADVASTVVAALSSLAPEPTAADAPGDTGDVTDGADGDDGAGGEP